MAFEHPIPATEAVRVRMSRQPSRDTLPELALRRELHRRGLRFRVHRRPIAGLRREADIVFGPARVAVFVMGCFWHGCPEHATWPRNNAAWWRDKLEKNRARDIDTANRLSEAGWTAVVVWEHESPRRAAARIERMVRRR